MLGPQIDNFLQMMAAEKGAAQTSIAAYERDLPQFIEFGPFIADNSLSEAGIKDRKLSAVREFCKFLYSEKIIDNNPAQNILTPKQEKPLPKFLTVDEINNIITAAKSSDDYRIHRIAVMIELMYATGLRVSELVALPHNAVNYKKNIVTIFGKGSKERLVPLAEHTAHTLQKYQTLRQNFIKKNGESPWLFPSLIAVDGHLTRDAFFKDIKNLAVRCGISPSRVSPHVLRHSFATHLLNNDADLRSVQKMLGHENITTTEIYTHITSQKLINSVCAKHPLAQFKEEDE